MKHVLCLLFFVAFVWPLSLAAQVPPLSWATAVNGNIYEYGSSIAVDAQGNVYSTGGFSGTADFDPGSGTFNMTAVGSMDIYIAKQDASGNFLWAKQLGGTQYDYGRSVAVDTFGNVYATGQFMGAGDFDPGAGTVTLTGPGSGSGAFAVKLDAAGNYQWAVPLGDGCGSAQGYCVSVDDNHAYFTGVFSGTGDFDPGVGTATLSTINLFESFIVKFDLSGNLVWADQLSGTKIDSPYGVTSDASGNVLVTGSFELGCDFDPGAGVFSITSVGQNDVFVLKLDANGNFVWAKTMGGVRTEEGRAIITDSNGDVYSTGYFSDTVDFDPGNGVLNFMTGSANYNAYVQRLDAAGNLVWAKQLGIGGSMQGTSIALDATGNIFTGGNFSGAPDFDPNTGTFTLTSFSGSEDVFISKLSNAGNFGWAAQFGGSGSEYSGEVRVASNGAVYLNGYFQNTADFDPLGTIVNLAATGQYDAFVLKLFHGTDGIAEQKISQLALYPNPAVDGLIRAYNPELKGTVTVEVYAADGRLVSREQFNQPQNITLQLPDVRGLYTVRLVAADGTTAAAKIMRP